MEKIIRFKGLCCANCANKIEKKLNKIKGVQATMSYVAGKILLELDDEVLLEKVIEVCKKEEPEMEIIL
ncbi:MAG: heavy-metal-associated domain-containing protein [Acholeplasmatales bacterium]|nr:heavy-metal-associated domain-containing protein [Acholeplasmatales bacterium]